MTSQPMNTDMAESLDQTVLQQLREDMGEDVDEVLTAFLESISELLDALKERDGDETHETLSRWAHSIKSSSASIGMMKLSATAEYLEKGLKQGIAVDIDGLVSTIEREYNDSRKLLFS